MFLDQNYPFYSGLRSECTEAKFVTFQAFIYGKKEDVHTMTPRSAAVAWKARRVGVEDRVGCGHVGVDGCWYIARLL